MARELGTFEFPSNFEVKKAGPIDARGLVTELTDLTSIPFQYYGQIVRVENVGLFYCSNPGSANIEDWLPVGSGGALEAIEGTSDINSIIIKDKREKRYGWDYDNNGVTAIESAKGIIDLSFASGSPFAQEEGVNYRSTYTTGVAEQDPYQMNWEGVPEKIIVIGPATKVSAKDYTIALGVELDINGDGTMAIGSQITQDPLTFSFPGGSLLNYYGTGDNTMIGHDIVVQGAVRSFVMGRNISVLGHEDSIIIGNTVLANEATDLTSSWDFPQSIIIIGNNNNDPYAIESTVIGHRNNFAHEYSWATGFRSEQGTVLGNYNTIHASNTYDSQENTNLIGHNNFVLSYGSFIIGNSNIILENPIFEGLSVLGSNNKVISGVGDDLVGWDTRKLLIGNNNAYNKELVREVDVSIGYERSKSTAGMKNDNPDILDTLNKYSHYGQWVVPDMYELEMLWRFKKFGSFYNNAVNNDGFQPLTGTYWSSQRGVGFNTSHIMVVDMDLMNYSMEELPVRPTTNHKARLILKIHPSEFDLYEVSTDTVKGEIISRGGMQLGVVISAGDDYFELERKEAPILIAAMTDYTPAANQFWNGNETTFPFFAADPIRPITTGFDGVDETISGAPTDVGMTLGGNRLSKTWYKARPSVFFWDLYNGNNGKARIKYDTIADVPTSSLEILETGEILAPNYLNTSQHADRGDKLMTQENVLDLKSGYEVTAAFKDQPSEIYVEPFTPIAYNRMGKISVPALDPSNYPATGTVELGNSNYSNLLNWVEEGGSNARAVVESGIKTVDGIAGFQTLVDSTTTSVAARGVIVVDGTTTSGSYDIASDTINQLDIFVAKTDDFQYFGMRYHANGTRPWVAFSTHKDSSANELVETSPGAQDVHFGDLANVASGAVGIYDIRMFGSVSTPNGYNRIQKIDYSDNIWLFRVTFTGIVGEGNASPSRIELAPAITRQSAWENPNSGQTSLATGQVDVFGISLVTSDAPGQEVPQLAYYNEIDYIGFSLDPGLRSTRNAPYWGEFEGPNGHTLDDFDGLFAGEYMPGGVDKLFNYDHLWINSVAASGYSVPATISSAVRQLLDPVGELCKGSIRLDQCRRGDRLEVRFDFYIRVTEACSVDVCLWYQNRNAQDEVTFDFELASTSLKFGAEDVGKTKLQRVPLTAWIATDQDLNAIALPAIKVSAPCYIRPATMKVHIER